LKHRRFQALVGLCVVAIYLYQQYGGVMGDITTLQIRTSFELPQSERPDTYPIEVRDYREVRRAQGDLRIFGRTVWHESVPGLGNRVAVVPVALEAFNVETGDSRVLHRILPSRQDGHFLFTVENPVMNYRLVLHVVEAEDCPPAFQRNAQ